MKFSNPLNKHRPEYEWDNLEYEAFWPIAQFISRSYRLFWLWRHFQIWKLESHFERNRRKYGSMWGKLGG